MPAEDRQLDVRPELPARRHALIFDAFEALGGGEGFVLLNHQDPKSLYYELIAEYPHQFSWDYLERGPDVWRVRIGRPAAEDDDVLQPSDRDEPADAALAARTNVDRQTVSSVGRPRVTPGGRGAPVGADSGGGRRC